jgi:hypothetical protein
MLSDKEIIKQFYGTESSKSGHKHISESGLSKQKKEDEVNRGFYNGDRAEYTYEMNIENKKLAVCFNRVKPYIHSFAGFAAQNRRKPEFFAMERDDQQREIYTETANRTLSWLRSTANADQVETAQDKELAICGYGAVIMAEDYMRNPDGEVTMVECTRDFFWDPSSCRMGMEDRRWEFLRKKMAAEVAVKMFGGDEKDFEATQTREFGPYEYYPAGGVYDKIAYDWVGSQEAGMVYIYEYHWYDIEPYWRMKNPVFDEQYQMDGRAAALLNAFDNMKKLRLGEEESEDLFSFNPRARIFALTKEQYDDVEAICQNLGIECEAERNLRKVFYEAVISGNKVFQKRKSIDQSGFAIKVKTSDYDYKNNLWLGMVSSLREPAKYANKAVTEFLLIVAGTSKPGVFYDLNMVPDPVKFEALAAKNAKALGVNGNPNVAIMNKQQPVLPNGYETLYPAFISALSQVIGFNPEALGVGDVSQPSFELEQQRIKQVMTTLAVYFDSITLYQKEHARSALYFMRRLARNNEGRALPIVDADGNKKVSEIYSDMIADEYAIDIGEAPDTPSQRKEQGIVMMSYADKVASLIPPKAAEAYALASEYLPIPISAKVKWRNLLVPPSDPEQAAAAAQEAQRKAKIEEDMLNTLSAKQAADAEYAQARAVKTIAETKKVEAETDQKNLENLTISTNPPNNLTMTI